MELYRFNPAIEKDYETIEKILSTMTQDQKDDFINKVNELVWAFGKEQCKKYNKIKEYLKKYELTIKMVRNWFFSR